jgi:HEAT repeat protein
MQLMWFSVGLHTTIRAVIPSLVDLLKDGHWNVRSMAVSLVFKLAKHGEFNWDLMNTRLTWFSVEFRETILATVPPLIDLLKDGHWDVRSVAISGFFELADQGEFDSGL